MEEGLRRCFVAIDLSREGINEIKRVQGLIKNQNLFLGKFTEPENLHLTLKFLGEIDDRIIKKVEKKLSKVKASSFFAEFGKVGVFSKNFIRIIWIELIGKIFELQKEIDLNLDGLFEKEQRFMSHITIARVKRVKQKKELVDYLENIGIKDLKFKVDRFFLKESKLFPDGPIYEDLTEYKLKK